MGNGKGKLKITIDGYLYTTRLGKEGEKFVTIEYPSSEAIKLAQLELMGRDLNNHLPILLRTSYEVSSEKTSYKSVTKEPKQRHFISRKKA
jgi:hypothetical protein